MAEIEKRRGQTSRSLKIWLVAGLIGLLAGLAGGYVATRFGSSPTQSTVTSGGTVTKDSATVAEVIKQTSPSVVSITASSSQGQAAGSGIVLSSDGLIMTNKHVVEATNAAYAVITSDGKEYKDAQVLARDPYNDVAFVRVKATNLTPAKLSDSKSFVVGQRVVAIGNALGQFQNTATEGIVSGYGRSITAGDGTGNTETLTNLIQTDAAINPGNSGGPLVTTAGEVIGMNTATADAQNIGFAIPISEIINQIKSIESTGKIVRPYLGVRYVALTPELAARYGLSEEYGAYLTSVLSGGPAEKASLQQDDIITKIDNTKLDETTTLQSVLASHQVDDTVTIMYVRDGKVKSAKVKLEQAPTQ